MEAARRRHGSYVLPVAGATDEHRARRVAETVGLAGLDDFEVAQFADCALASLHARISGSESRELSDAIEAACDAWDRFADLLPEVVTFIRTGHFSSAAVRQPPAIDPLATE